jgi:hypothetical protein
VPVAPGECGWTRRSAIQNSPVAEKELALLNVVNFDYPDARGAPAATHDGGVGARANSFDQGRFAIAVASSRMRVASSVGVNDLIEAKFARR